MAECQDPEEEVGVQVPLLDLSQEGLVVELEGGLVEPVLGEVHSFGVLRQENRKESYGLIVVPQI
jgi:hypothetical protein